MSIWRLPHILIIQLKRFSYKFGHYSNKIDNLVEFPLEGLNLQPYMPVEPEDGPAVYDLYGVINHMGQLFDGHYNAYARLLTAHDSRLADIDWRFFDDAHVKFWVDSHIVGANAYLLLYRRRDTPFSLHRPLAPPLPLHTPEENDTEEESL